MHRLAAGAVLMLLGAAAGLAQAPAASDKADALWEAARKGDAAVVKKLLDEGVDVNTKFRYGATALSYACDRGHVDVVRLLLDRGADVNVKDTFYGATPLTWATNPATGRKPQHVEIVTLLLQRGAQGKDMALMGALQARDLAMAKVILDSGGIAPGLLSDALEAAKQRGQQDAVALLDQAGAKPRVEFKMDAAKLARYAGTYSGPNGADVVLTVANGRITGGLAGQPPLTFVARDETTFGVSERPGLTVTFRLDQGKATMFTFGEGPGAQTFTRKEGQ
jgi:hypothetical protein